MKFSQAFFSASLVFVLGLIFWLSFNLEFSLLGSLGWWSWPFGIVAGALIYFLVFLVTKLFWGRMESMQHLMENLHHMFKEFSWFSIVVISIMAGVGEELLLRGVLQNTLVSYLGPVAGILLASLVFGLMHYLSKVYVLVTFTLGLAFGVAYHFSDSLALVMIAHAVYDVFAFAVIVKYPSLLNIRTGAGGVEKLLIK